LRKRIVALMAGALVLALLVGGCGGGDDNGGSGSATAENATSAEGGNAGGEAGSEIGGEGEGSGSELESGGSTEAVSPEKVAFSEKANAGCLKSNKKARAEILKELSGPKITRANTEAEAIRFETEVLVPILVTDAESRLKAIGGSSPPIEDQSQVKAILDSLEQWIEKAKATPLKIVVADDIFNEARELAGKYPLVKCGLSPFEEP
jgi:hypothetical protein